MDILFFAAIAVFIFFKLREQLGKVDEDQKRDSIKKFIKEQTRIINPNKTQDKSQEKSQSQENSPKIIAIPGVGIVVANASENKIDEKSQKILDGLEPNLKADLELVLQKTKLYASTFLEGAKSAFEIIISSFSIVDLATLKVLLSEKIYLQFQAAIEDRNSKNELLNTKIISIDEANITSAKIENGFAIATIAFKSKQINYVENNQKEIISGNKTEINTIIDNWTFKKDCNSTNPNWLLVATS
jgi:predicted lipid-binding transport protein (Tim44 family)